MNYMSGQPGIAPRCEINLNAFSSEMWRWRLLIGGNCFPELSDISLGICSETFSSVVSNEILLHRTTFPAQIETGIKMVLARTYDLLSNKTFAYLKNGIDWTPST